MNSTAYNPYKLGDLPYILGIALLYHITGVAGQLVGSLPPGIVTAIWPPSGIALAAIFLLGYRFWIGVFLGALLNNFFFLYSPEAASFSTLFVVVEIALGATLQAVCGAWLLLRFVTEKNPFLQLRNTAKFLVCGIASCLINATLGPLVVIIGGLASWSLYPALWWTWWLGDATGVAIMAPFIITWALKPIVKLSQAEAAEAFMLLITAVTLEQFLFKVNNTFLYTIMLVPIWAVLRFGTTGATLALMCVVVPAIWDTVNGNGPFVTKSQNDSLLMLQAFMGVCSTMTLILGSILEEKEHVLKLLQISNSALEKTVTEQIKELVTEHITLEKTLGEVAQMQHKVMTQEKLASLGTLIAGIAHEIKNPLNFVNNFASLCIQFSDELESDLAKQREAMPPEAYHEMIDNIQVLKTNVKKIIEHGKRANSIVQSMLLHVRGKPGQHQPTDINSLIKEYAYLAYHGLRAQDHTFNVRIETAFDPAITHVDVIPGDIGRVFLNISNNAYYAADKKKKRLGETFDAVVWITTKDCKEHIEISIKDNGDGIPPEVYEKLFTPFFTTKPPGQGTGLGLSISHNIIVQEHQGNIRVNTVPGEYTEFIISIPKSLAEISAEIGDESVSCR